jgi:hypothetical protein
MRLPVSFADSSTCVPRFTFPAKLGIIASDHRAWIPSNSIGRMLWHFGYFRAGNRCNDRHNTPVNQQQRRQRRQLLLLLLLLLCGQNNLIWRAWTSPTCAEV